VTRHFRHLTPPSSPHRCKPQVHPPLAPSPQQRRAPGTPPLSSSPAPFPFPPCARARTGPGHPWDLPSATGVVPGPGTEAPCHHPRHPWYTGEDWPRTPREAPVPRVRSPQLGTGASHSTRGVPGVDRPGAFWRGPKCQGCGPQELRGAQGPPPLPCKRSPEGVGCEEVAMVLCEGDGVRVKGVTKRDP